MGRRHARHKLLVVNLVVFLGLIACLEVGARWFFPRQIEGLFNDPQVFLRKRPFVAPHPRRGLALVPGFESDDIRINAAGFRGSEWPDDLGNYDIVLTLGESSTFGWLVGDEDSYPARLQRKLRATTPGRRVMVVNAGVPSYTSAQVRLYLEELLERLDPVLILVNVLWNDALFACVENWMPEYLVFQQPRPWKQFAIRHSALMRAAILKPPAEGQSATIDSNSEALRFYARNLDDIVQQCNRKGTRLAFVRPSMDLSFVPERGMKISRRTIERQSFIDQLEEFTRTLDVVAREHAIPVVGHRLSASDPLFRPCFLDPVHLNAEGNRLLAEDIAAYLVQSDLLPAARIHIAGD